MRARRRNASKRSVRRRVAKALKKYVRGNSSRTRATRREARRAGFPSRAIGDSSARGVYRVRRSRERGRFAKAPGYTSEQRAKLNPPRVKGRKVKGGRAVTLRNFTGTIVKKSDGTVGILGRGRRK